MKRNRSPDVIKICQDNFEIGCRECCPLSLPCEARSGDDFEIFTSRMNLAAEKINHTLAAANA